MIAAGLGAVSIALPALSAGAYGWPVEEVAAVAVSAAQAAPTGITDIRFVLMPPIVVRAFVHAAIEALGPSGQGGTWDLPTP